MQERSQGLVMSTRANSDEDDSVAGGTIISGIRQMHPVPVLLPPEQCPDLLEVFGCPADKQVGGRVTRANFLLAIARPEPRDKNARAGCMHSAASLWLTVLVARLTPPVFSPSAEW